MSRKSFSRSKTRTEQMNTNTHPRSFGALQGPSRAFKEEAWLSKHYWWQQ